VSWTSSWQDFLDDYPVVDRALKAVGGTTDEGLGPDAVLIRLVIAGLIGWLIGYVYRKTFTGKKFSPTLPDTHMLLALGGALIWLVVGSNIVRAFGLAGTIGLIRYRTIVRDPKDTTLLLFSMVLGMACGLGQYPVAFVGFFVTLFALLWLYYHDRLQRNAEARKSQNILDLLNDDDAAKPK
jgi:uncharacterized membrane protein YhiD involved in acid resistance